jgi:uncharacterized protein YggE
MSLRNVFTGRSIAGIAVTAALFVAIACAAPTTHSPDPTGAAASPASPGQAAGSSTAGAGGVSAVGVSAPPVAAIAPAPVGASVAASSVQQALPPVPSAAPNQSHVIVVSGSGNVQVKPDQAYVSAGVQTRGRTAQEAQTENNQSMQSVINAIKALGIPATNIQTDGVSLSPQYDNQQNLTGYVATNNVEVRVDQIDQAGAVLDAAVQAGANQAGNIRFTLKDDTASRNQALALAAKDARSKADALAAALNLQITGVDAVSEQSVSVPLLVQPRSSFAANPAAPVPVEPGQLTVSAQVTIQFSY